MGARVRVVAPRTLLTAEIERLGVEVLPAIDRPMSAIRTGGASRCASQPLGAGESDLRYREPRVLISTIRQIIRTACLEQIEKTKD